MNNIAGKTDQYAQFIYRLAATFALSREDELHGNLSSDRRSNDSLYFSSSVEKNDQPLHTELH